MHASAVVALLIFIVPVYLCLPFEAKGNELQHGYFSLPGPFHLFRPDRPIKFEKPQMNFVQVLEPVEDAVALQQSQYSNQKSAFLSRFLHKIQSRLDAVPGMGSFLPILPFIAGFGYLLFIKATTPVVKMRSNLATEMKDSLLDSPGLPLRSIKQLHLMSVVKRGKPIRWRKHDTQIKPPEAPHRSGCRFCGRTGKTSKFQYSSKLRI